MSDILSLDERLTVLENQVKELAQSLMELAGLVALDAVRDAKKAILKCDPSCEIFGTEHSCGDKCKRDGK